MRGSGDSPYRESPNIRAVASSVACNFAFPVLTSCPAASSVAVRTSDRAFHFAWNSL